MAFRVFTIPISYPDLAEAELNSFLRSHRVLSIERRWVDQGPASFWAFCVDYLDAAIPRANNRFDRGGQRPKVDYKEKLSAGDFEVYCKLREFRKQLSQTEAVPVYTVFTNEQLAHMAEKKARSKASLEEITGVGDARLEKYGERLLTFLNSLDGAKP